MGANASQTETVASATFLLSIFDIAKPNVTYKLQTKFEMNSFNLNVSATNSPRLS